MCASASVHAGVLVVCLDWRVFKVPAGWRFPRPSQVGKSGGGGLSQPGCWAVPTGAPAPGTLGALSLGPLSLGPSFPSGASTTTVLKGKRPPLGPRPPPQQELECPGVGPALLPPIVGVQAVCRREDAVAEPPPRAPCGGGREGGSGRLGAAGCGTGSSPRC